MCTRTARRPKTASPPLGFAVRPSVSVRVNDLVQNQGLLFKIKIGGYERSSEPRSERSLGVRLWLFAPSHVSGYLSG